MPRTEGRDKGKGCHSDREPGFQGEHGGRNVGCVGNTQEPVLRMLAAAREQELALASEPTVCEVLLGTDTCISQTSTRVSAPAAPSTPRTHGHSQTVGLVS